MNFMFDIRYALRNLIKSSGFSALTIGVMTIGLGASIFITSIVRNLLFEPIYFPEGERVGVVFRVINDSFRPSLLHDYQKLVDESESLDLVSGYHTETAVLSDEFSSVRYRGTWVVGDFFKLTGVEPYLGRILTPEDHIPGALPVAVLSYELWQNFFGEDKSIIGKHVRLNQNVVEVVGVAKEGISYPIDNTLWIPMQEKAHELSLGDSPAVRLYARLKKGVTFASADHEMQAIYANSPELMELPDQILSAKILPYKLANMGGGAHIFYIMLTASFSVLILCCINVGNLLLARVNARLKEVAIRLALGVPRNKLVAQIMWEAFFICAIGGVLALLLAGWGIDTTLQYFISRSQFFGFPKWAYIYLNSTDVLLGVGITALTIFFTGFIPGWQATKIAFNEVLKDGSKTALGKKSGWISRLLVAVQITLSCAIMIIAGVQYILVQQAISKGYGVVLDNYISGRVNPLRSYYPEGAAVESYFDRILTEVRQIPGVEKATLVSTVPTEGARGWDIEPEGGNWKSSEYLRVKNITTYPNSFETFDIALIEGRFFDSRDTRDSPLVTIISDLLAEKLWPNESPIGKRIRAYSNSNGSSGDWYSVIGVVPQIIYQELFDSDLTPNMYLPYSQNTIDAMAVVLKTEGDPAMYQNDLARAVLKVDPNTPIYRSLPLRLQAEDASMFQEFMKRVFALFAICALVMAATGIYGIMANHVKRRTQEIGIRRALGIPDQAIIGLLLRQSVIQLVVGFTFGLPLGYIISQIFVSNMGPGSHLYMSMYLAVPALITLVVITATIQPLMTAFSQSPSAALRYE